MKNSAAPVDNSGWDVGVRQTINAPLDTVWAFLLGEGMPIWLGHTTLTLEKEARYATDDDIFGHVISVSPKTRLRMTWQPGEWDHDSTLHVTLKKAEGGTTLGFEQERLASREERKIMLGHWKDVLARLDDALATR